MTSAEDLAARRRARALVEFVDGADSDLTDRREICSVFGDLGASVGYAPERVALARAVVRAAIRTLSDGTWADWERHELAHEVLEQSPTPGRPRARIARLIEDAIESWRFRRWENRTDEMILVPLLENLAIAAREFGKLSYFDIHTAFSIVKPAKTLFDVTKGLRPKETFRIAATLSVKVGAFSDRARHQSDMKRIIESYRDACSNAGGADNTDQD